MKKLLFLGLIALTGCLWADRTANQGWVQKNFAPSNLVGRVEALEGATESDPVFATWKTNASVAVGAGASASGVGAVQIGTGTNTTANTLRFKGYQLVDASGNIPAARLGAAIPKDATAGIYLTDRSKWYVDDYPFLAIGYKFQGHSRIPDDPEEYWACSPYAWNFSYNMLRVSGEGVDIGGSLLFDKEYEMMNYLGNDYETLDERIERVADTSSCIKHFPMSGYDDSYYCIDKGILVANAAKTDYVAQFNRYRIRNEYISVTDEGTYFGEDRTMLLNPYGPSISVDDCAHYLDFPTGRNGTFALTSDLDAMIPRNGTNGVVLADRSKWYIGNTNNLFLALGYSRAGHSRKPDVRDEWYVCSPWGWDFSYGALRVDMNGVAFGNGLVLEKGEMYNEFGDDYETLDERIARLNDTASCVRYVENEGFKDIAYPLTKGVVVLNAAGTDSVAELTEYGISCKYLAAGEEGTYFGATGNMVLSPGGPSISVDGCRHWMDFQSGKNGTIALTSDINAANVLTAIKAMTDAQKAELKAALGL